MGGFTPYEKANTLCISVLQNHSPIPSSEEDMTCSHASPKYKASTSTTHFLPTLAVRSIPDVTHQELKVRWRPIFILMWHIGKTDSRGTDKQDREGYRHFPYNIIDIQYYNTNTPTAKITEPRRLRRSHRNADRVSSGISNYAIQEFRRSYAALMCSCLKRFFLRVDQFWISLMVSSMLMPGCSRLT